MFDKNNFEKCFYTPEELEEAINSMSSNEAYRLATSYYNIVNSISQFNKEKIDNIAQNSQNMAEYVRRYSSELEERPGFGKYLGTELVPTADIEFEQKLRQALIIVDNEFRTGKGKGMFIRDFADVLPKPFIEMIFVLAIENQNTLMLEAIKKNNFDLFTTLDEQLKDSNPEFRQKAISQGTLYASGLLEAIFCKINSQHQDNGFEEAADLFSTLSADQKRDYFLYLMLHDCFEVSQNNCSNIDTYINNKKIFIEKALGLHRGMPDGNTIIGSMPADLLASSVKVCTFDYAVDRLYDVLFESLDVNGKIDPARYKEVMSYAYLLLRIDLDERIKCKNINEFFYTSQEVQRTPRQINILNYLNGLIRDDINSVEKARAYIKMHDQMVSGERVGFLTPNSDVMERIISQYGNDPQIKELLFQNCAQINHLWEVIPYNSLPKEYTTYEKMLAGVQIISNDIMRAIGSPEQTGKKPEIPQDILDRIFDSKECITRILFPGLDYNSNLSDVLANVEIGKHDKNINANILLGRVLNKVSNRLKKEDYYDELLNLYTTYAKHKIDAASFIDFDAAREFIILHECPVTPRSLFESAEAKASDIDTSTEFNVDMPKSTHPSTATYSNSELVNAKETLILPEAISILESYYEQNDHSIFQKRRDESTDIRIDMSVENEEQRILGTELVEELVGRGDLLRQAAIIFDNVLFGENDINDEDFNRCHTFVEKFVAFLPVDFLIKYNQLLIARNIKPLDIPKSEINAIVSKEDSLIKTCRKYLNNETYRKHNQIDIHKLANIINNMSFDNMDRDTCQEKGLNYLLVTMIVCYAKYEYEKILEGYKNGEVPAIDDVIRLANDKATSSLLKMGMTTDEFTSLKALYYREGSSGCYPMYNTMLEAMMNRAFCSRHATVEVETDDSIPEGVKRGKLRYYFSQMVINNNVDAVHLFKNISPNAFLSWDLMSEVTLMRMLLLMGRNDIDVISLLHEATGNDDTLLKEANPDLSEEALMQFKKRLRKVKNAIFNSRDSKLHYYFISGVNPRENKTQDYPVHKQPANEYLKRLMEYLSKEQREEIDLSKIFENELRADNRCKEIDLHTFLIELRHINVELNTKSGNPHR